MSKKHKLKIEIDGTTYTQVRKDTKDGEPIWWMNVPELKNGEFGSGLHVIHGETSHYDFYENNKKLPFKEEVDHKIGGIVLTQDGSFVLPPDKVLILNNGMPTFISYEEYLRNKYKHKVLYPRNDG